MVPAGGAAEGRPVEMVRQRLIDALAERWNERLIRLEAPAGYGKSVAIAQAIDDNAHDPSGIDAYVPLRSSHRSSLDAARSVVLALAEAVGGNDTRLREFADLDAAVEAIGRAVAEASPQDMCVHLDDVHLVDGIGELIAALVDRLPVNGHLLVSGRSTPAGIEIDAGGALVVGPDALAFDTDEVIALAAQLGVDDTELDVSARSAAEAAGGWPAMTRLSLAGARASSAEAMIAEIVDGMDEADRTAVAVAAIAGSADASLLSRFCGDVSVGDLMRRIPLLRDLGDGSFGVHDLWLDMVERLASAERRREIATEVVRRRAEVLDRHGALVLALEHQLWIEARSEVMAVVEQVDVAVSLDDVTRWLGAFPDSQRDEPELAYIRGLASRLAGDFAGGVELIQSAESQFWERGEHDRAATACRELGLHAWLLGDAELWGDLTMRRDRLLAAGNERVRRYAAAGHVITAERNGRFAEALAIYETIPVRDELELRHSSTLAMLCGEGETAMALVDEIVERFDSPLVEQHRRFVHWQCGSLEPYLETRSLPPLRLDNVRNRFLASVLRSMVEASFGTTPDVAPIEELVWDRGRERTYVALLWAVRELLDGSEDGAAAVLAERIDEIGFDDPMLRGELLRYLPYGYVLVDPVREWIDGLDDLGPLHRDTRTLARQLVSLRTSPNAPVGAIATDESVLAWLPLPWSVEFAARLAAQDDWRGPRLMNTLADVVGAPTHQVLRRLADDGIDTSVRRGASELLAAVPLPPASSTRVTLCGPVTFETNGVVETTPRRRVRQLVQLLALRPEWTRTELVDALWPDFDETKARANLRTNMKFLRQLLEPDRSTGVAPFHLRLRDERIWLQQSEFLEIDVWTLRLDLERARAAQAEGDDGGAVDAYESALAHWTSDAFADVRSVPDVMVEIAELEQRVLAGGCWAGERLLSRGDVDAASRTGARVVELDPFNERAYDVLIGARLVAHDLAGAAEMIDRCLAMLDELDVSPSTGTQMLIRRHRRRAARDTPVVNPADEAYG